MRFARATLLLLSAACVAPVPQGAVRLAPETVQRARAAWVSAGLPEPRCAAPWWLTVDADEYQAQCRHPSCAAVSGENACSHGCTRFEYAEPVAFYAGESTNQLIAWVPEWRTQTHETWHVWAACTLGDPDAAHARAPIWRDAWAELLRD